MKRYLTILFLALMLVLANIGVAAAAPGLQVGPQIHYVGFGDSLYGIAARYGVSATAIMQANGIVNPDMIYVGQPLRIPGPAGYGADYYAGSPSGDCVDHHVVRAGETLSGVAWQYGVPVDTMMAHNRLYNQDMVFTGQELCVPGSAGYAAPAVHRQEYAPAADLYYHTVTAGDTVSGIAFRYGVGEAAIIRANNLGYGGIIWEGQRLIIPGYAPHPAPPKLPPPAAPPQKPYYDDAYDDVPPPPPPVPPDDAGQLPAAPGYQAQPVPPELPLASQPIEVVVNGGQSWVGEAFPASPDPNEITTLVVGTDDKSEVRTVYIQSGDYLVKGELGLNAEFGVDKFRFAFRYIPPGDYDVWIEDPETPSEKVHVKMEAGQRVEVDFKKGLAFSGPTFASPDGWYLADWDNPSKPHENIGGWSNILVHAPAPGLWVKIRSEGNGYEAKCFTGSKGPGSCDFAGLTAGLYYIWIDGTDLTLKTYMDGSAYASFTFGRQAVPGQEDKVGPVSYN